MRKRTARRVGAQRRKPVQMRAQVTVEAMLDGAVKLLKRGGASWVTTNRIAATAGVSIGSVYQYFPNKHALFAALHERHLRQVDAIMQKRTTACEEASLEDLAGSWIEGMVEAHAGDPELSELLYSEVPHRANGTSEFSSRLHKLFRDALAPHWREFGGRIDLDTAAFVVANLVDGLGHAVALQRPRGLSLRKAKAEACKAILGYLGC
jgi:AcrR family transcriptional regulator